MHVEIKTIKCQDIPSYRNSNRSNDFKVVVYSLDYEREDKEFIDRIINSGKRLAHHVNPAAANNAFHKRTKERLVDNCVAGVLAEYCWKKFLNDTAGDKIVDFTDFKGASIQIDLITLNSKKLIEVRSSFPRNGLEFAICHSTHEFDILGPYSNQVKPSEIQKDFYTRTLFHVPQGADFVELLKSSDFKVYLTGGASWDMMMNDNYSQNKNLLPEDALSKQEESTYRVVPFSKALDSMEIYDLILKA
jgi:hypothetical protein